MVSQLLVQGCLQIGCAHSVNHMPIRSVAQEELSLICDGRCDILFSVNVSLASVNNPHIACMEQKKVFILCAQL